jgi:hypothetical protein
VKEANIESLSPAEEGDEKPEVEQIFATLGEDRTAGARLALGRLKETGNAEELIDAARVLTFLKGNDAHDYKFSSAALEDYYLVSPTWRDKYLAASMYLLNTAAEKDNRLVERTRRALNT